MTEDSMMQLGEASFGTTKYWLPFIQNIILEHCNREILQRLTNAKQRILAQDYDHAIIEVSIITNHLMEILDNFRYNRDLPSNYRQARIDRNADILEVIGPWVVSSLHFIRKSRNLVLRGIFAKKWRAQKCITILSNLYTVLGLESAA